MPRKFSDEFKDKAVRLAEELVELEGCSKWAAAEEIGEKLGVSAHRGCQMSVSSCLCVGRDY
ncbi:transposase [Corynebacterium mycetoides]|uniref:Transposase n=1 Tax=Corynebacterium mycetoides TaxID=38302 RepID=A0A1G9P999_9CORY|nr:hypothetical protein [Corynebacterium mycetoides]SDL95339.1 transposase [Corynebacterium mycetoides]